jgi:ACS family glucarate transporter-like MFS transporter
VYDATGSFVVPLVIVGVVAVVGALAYLLLIRRVEPLPVIAPVTA